MISFKSFITESRQRNTRRMYRTSRVRRVGGKIRVQRNVIMKNKSLPSLKAYRLVKQGNKSAKLVRMSPAERRNRSKRNPNRLRGFRKRRAKKNLIRNRFMQTYRRRRSLGIKE